MGGYSSVATVVSNIASRFTTVAQETKLKNFNTKNQAKFGTSHATLLTAEKTVAENLQWAENKLGAFKTFLEKRAKNSSATLNGFTALTLVLVAAVAALFH